MSTAKWQNIARSKNFFTKGQFISKWSFGVQNSPKLQQKEFLPESIKSGQKLSLVLNL